MSKVSGGIKITALMDGTTLNGFLRVDNMPLIQRYAKGGTRFVPDFTAVAENNRPVVAPVIRDITDGSIFKPNTITFKYNGLDLAFGSDGLCTTPNFVGFFKKINDYSLGAGLPSVPAIRIMKNLVPVSGYDNDRISVTGTVEAAGYSLPFAEMSTAVVIQPASEQPYDLTFEFEQGAQSLDNDTNQVTAKAVLWKSGEKVADMSGLTFQWVKAFISGDVNMGTAQTQVFTKADVDGSVLVRCDVKKGGTTVISEHVTIHDFSDSYFMTFGITGINGSDIRKGQTAKITPKVVRKDGKESGTNTFKFFLRDNEGNPFILGGKTNPFTAGFMDLSYSEAVRAHYGVQIIVEADVTV